MEPYLQEIGAAIATGLPVRARWTVNGTPLDFDFSAARRDLRPLPDDATEPGDAGEADLLVFGEQDYAEGGGARPWICVRKSDGSVWGYDPGREQPLFLLNSSVRCFAATFRLLHEHLAKYEPPPSGCESRLREIDPDAYPSSEWRLLVESLASA